MRASRAIALSSLLLNDPVHPKPQPLSQSEKVKDQILWVLKVDGAQTATALAGRLDVSPMAIRQHLQGLQRKQWVAYGERRQSVGRPVKLWHLTDIAQRIFPDNHADLVLSLFESAEQVFGAEGVDALIHHRATKQIQTYGTVLGDMTNWGDRTRAIAQLRTQEGYMAEVIEQPDGSVLLVENHCSICDAARRCPTLCASELEVFSALLGEGITIQRREHILEGDRRCAYHIRLSSQS